MRSTVLLLTVFLCFPLIAQGQNSFSINSVATIPGSVVDVVIRHFVSPPRRCLYEEFVNTYPISSHDGEV